MRLTVYLALCASFCCLIWEPRLNFTLSWKHHHQPGSTTWVELVRVRPNSNHSMWLALGVEDLTPRLTWARATWEVLPAIIRGSTAVVSGAGPTSTNPYIRLACQPVPFASSATADSTQPPPLTGIFEWGGLPGTSTASKETPDMHGFPSLSPFLFSFLLPCPSHSFSLNPFKDFLAFVVTYFHATITPVATHRNAPTSKTALCSSFHSFLVKPTHYINNNCDPGSHSNGRRGILIDLVLGSHVLAH